MDTFFLKKKKKQLNMSKLIFFPYAYLALPSSATTKEIIFVVTILKYVLCASKNTSNHPQIRVVR